MYIRYKGIQKIRLKKKYKWNKCIKNADYEEGIVVPFS